MDSITVTPKKLFYDKTVGTLCFESVDENSNSFSYYIDEIGKYKEKGNYIAVHVLKITNIGKDKTRTEQFYEKTSRPIKNCLQSLIGGIWEL